MYKFACSLLFFLLGTVWLSAADPNCPAYPAALRTEIQASLALDRAAQVYARSVQGIRRAVSLGSLADSSNPIDQLISAKMSGDGVVPAARTSEPEFLRRIYLDLTGRIPTPEQAERFLNSTETTKRAQLIEELLS